MISIPCAVATNHFKWQISLFEFNHFKVYGEDAHSKAIIPIVNRNYKSDAITTELDWGLRLPHKLVDSVLDMFNFTEPRYIVNNVFTAAYQVTRDVDDEEYLEIIDADLFHLKKYDGYLPSDNEVVVDATYENWHLKVNSDNRNIIHKYLHHNDYQYMNGGFNVILKKKVFDKIYHEAVETSIKVSDEYPNTSHSWWALMYGLNVACHNSKIKMVDGKNCYYPNINELKESHHIAHYSCDPLFNKNKFHEIKWDNFPNNKFYKSITEWKQY